MPVRIHRERTKGWKMPPNTVYVGRPSPWGNPFTFPFLRWDLALHLYGEAVRGGWDPNVLKSLTGQQVHIVYQAAERWKANLRAKLGSEATQHLVGQNLACWCPLDQPCHADVLLEIANG